MLPPVLRVRRQEHPGVQVRLHEHQYADQLLAAMQAGQADVALNPLPGVWDSPILELDVEEFVVVLPAGP